MSDKSTVNTLDGAPTLYKTVLRSEWDKIQLELAALRAQQPVAMNELRAQLISDLDEIGSMTRYLRHGGCDSTDLQGLEEGLTHATDMANELVSLLEQQGTQQPGVVLPERKEGDHYTIQGLHMARGWNACLDEVARLNASPVSAGEIPFAGFDPNFCPGSNPENPQSPDDHEASAQSVPSVQITGHLDEVDAPVWEFIHAEARKLDPLTGSIDSYNFLRPNGAQPNGVVVVLWNGQKIHAVALAVRDAMNRTQCVRLLAAAPSPAPSADVVPRELPADWEDRILDAMNRAFEIGRLKDGGLVIDDTQVGVEFACKQISALLNGGRDE